MPLAGQPPPGAAVITYAGQSFDHSPDGNPLGLLKEETIPIREGLLHFQIAPGGAALLTIVP